MQEIIELLFKNLAEFGGQIKASQDRHRAAFKKNEPKYLSDLRCCLDGSMASLYRDVNEPIENLSDVIEYQLSVSASFIKTHFLLNDLILDGSLIESFVLLRKQLESLARLEELNSKTLKQLEGETPNIRNAIRGSAGPIYGALSKIAHFALFEIHGLLSIAPKTKHAETTVFSEYTEDSIDCMKLRLYLGLEFIRWMTAKLPAWYPKRDWHAMEERLKLLFGIAIDSGLIKESKQS